MKRLALIFILFAAALGGLIYSIGTRDRERPEAAVSNNRPVFTFKSADIAEIDLARRGDQTYKIRNHEGQWVITEPVNTPADQSVVGTIADGFKDARVERNITVSPEAMRSYGLEQPPLVIEFKLRNGESHRVRFGAVEFSSSLVYGRIDESREVALLPAWLLANADQPLNDLRDRSLIDLSQDDLKSLVVDNDNGQFRLVKDGNHWILKSRQEAAADSVAVESILDGIRSGKAKEFASETAENLATYGLDRPKISLIAQLKNGAEQRLLLGTRIDDLYYAKRADRPQVFKVEPALYDKLNVSVAKLYDRNIIRFNAEDLVRFRIKNRYQTIIAEKAQGGVWKIAEPVGKKGKDLDLEIIFNILKTTRADEVTDHAPPRVMAKLAVPAVEIQLTDKSGTTQLLKISAVEGNSVYTRRDDSSKVYKNSKYILERMSFKLSDLINDALQ